MNRKDVLGTFGIPAAGLRRLAERLESVAPGQKRL